MYVLTLHFNHATQKYLKYLNGQLDILFTCQKQFLLTFGAWQVLLQVFCTLTSAEALQRVLSEQ